MVFLGGCGANTAGRVARLFQRTANDDLWQGLVQHGVSLAAANVSIGDQRCYQKRHRL